MEDPVAQGSATRWVLKNFACICVVGWLVGFRFCLNKFENYAATANHSISIAGPHETREMGTLNFQKKKEQEEEEHAPTKKKEQLKRTETSDNGHGGEENEKKEQKRRDEEGVNEIMQRETAMREKKTARNQLMNSTRRMNIRELRHGAVDQKKERKRSASHYVIFLVGFTLKRKCHHREKKSLSPIQSGSWTCLLPVFSE